MQKRRDAPFSPQPCSLEGSSRRCPDALEYHARLLVDGPPCRWRDLTHLGDHLRLDMLRNMSESMGSLVSDEEDSQLPPAPFSIADARVFAWCTRSTGQRFPVAEDTSRGLAQLL